MVSRWLGWTLAAALVYTAVSWVVLNLALPPFSGQAVIARVVPIAMLVLTVGLALLFAPHAGFTAGDIATFGVLQGLAERRYFRRFMAALRDLEASEAGAKFFAPIAGAEPGLIWDDKPISLSEAYERSRKPLLISGEGGSGKSRALRWLATRLVGTARQELMGVRFRLPVLLDMGVVQAREQGREASLIAHIEECLGGASRRMAARTHAYLESGAMALLLDDMDAAEPHGAVVQALGRLPRLFPEVKVVMACRRSATPALADALGAGNVNAAEIAVLDSAQVRSLLEVYLERATADALWDRLTARGLLDVVSNPLALWRTVCVWQSTAGAAEVSDNRGLMMEAYLRCLPTQVVGQKERSLVDDQKGVQALGEWAFGLLKSHLVARQREEARRELSALLGGDEEGARRLTEGAVTCGVLAYVGSGLVAPRDYVRFVRREFQEFFAARYLQRAREQVDVAPLARDAERWWEVLILLTGILPPRERLEWMSRVLASSRDPVLVVGCIVGGQVSDVRLESQALTVLREALQSGLSASQEQSLVSLGRGGAARAIEFIARLLDEQDRALRWAAVRFLRRAGGTYVAAPLVDRGLVDPFGGIRLYVARSLHECAWSEANVDYLVRSAQSDVFYERAIELLVSIGGQPVAETAIHHLTESADHRVRRAGARVLGLMRWKEALDPLVAALKDKDASVRVEAARAVGGLGEKRSVEPLTVALKDPCPRVRWIALRALAALGHRWAVPHIMGSLRDRNVRVREEAAVTLQRLSQVRAAPEKPTVRTH